MVARVAVLTRLALGPAIDWGGRGVRPNPPRQHLHKVDESAVTAAILLRRLGRRQETRSDNAEANGRGIPLLSVGALSAPTVS